MQLAMIGLGRMGANIVRRLMRDGHECVVYDVNEAAIAQLEGEGAVGARSLEELAAKLTAPRAAWVMVPAALAAATVNDVAAHLSPGDIVIDGGNSYYRDDLDRARECAALGVHFVDVGTSGGVFGLERGYCMMVGGEPAVIQRLEAIFQTLAPGRGNVERTPGRDKLPGTAEDGWLHCGPVGSGHFVKMVHNGIEYGLMQALAEGFDILRGANNPTVDPAHRFVLPVADIAEVWRRGSVLSSWLVDLTAKALVDDPALTKFTGQVQDSGEGRWTVLAAVEESIPADVIATSLFTRFRSRQEQSFAEKVLSAMRFQFGGHVERPTGG